MGARSKRKGKRGELEAAGELRRLFRCEARRGVQYHGGDDSPDVLTDIPQVHFEVKRAETLRLYPAVQQAAEDAGDQVPVVLHRANGRPWLSIVPLDRLPDLAVQLYLKLADT